MARYDIEISATAEKQIRKIPQKDQIAVIRRIRELATQPRPQGSRKLQGYDDVYRIRVRNYRILYSVEDRRLIIIILKVGHRRDVYR
ncbi:MAG: type II toxin-antitoxin system RelE/ParE family toxin [Gammaproteobacteria bacterium]|nr:type II toxin-antitoxin system RelE/ParE family toxin [Gammaproteobacteria bacterium]